ncbi:DUTPase (Dut)-like protein, partial [Leptotrombidium deliense]
MNITVQRVNEKAIIPRIATKHSAGYDLFSVDDIIIKSHTVAKISTGLKFHIPSTHFAKIESKSGLAFYCNVHVAAGVIDSDYRGEIKVILCNQNDVDFRVVAGMSIAQIIFIPYS